MIVVDTLGWASDTRQTTTGEPMRSFVAYLRVSTSKQERSGLGLEAQQQAIAAFLGPRDTLLSPPFIETESGRKADRPQLHAAIEKCRRTGATLLIAKLDRLSRDAHFLLGLQKAGVEFVACDMPTANRLTVGIMALVAEEEARMISARTKAALAAAKARGVVLGGDRGARNLTREDAREGARKAAEVRVRAADHKAHAVLPAIKRLRDSGVVTLNGIADALNANGIKSARGGLWTATSVKRALARIGD